MIAFCNSQYKITIHKTQTRAGLANKTINISVFDQFDVFKYFVEIDGIWYPKGPMNIKYARNDYLDQYRDFNFFFENYAKEPLNGNVYD